MVAFFRCILEVFINKKCEDIGRCLMEIHQLKTLVTVAREGSITRAAERLYLSQPAVSAHIKAIEETLGLTLFERTHKGMSLTNDGQRLLVKAEQILSVHREFIEEAASIKGRVSGKLHIGAGGNASTEILSQLLIRLSEHFPEVEVVVHQYGTSIDIQKGIRDARLDAGFYSEVGETDATFMAIEVSRFGIFLAAPVGLVPISQSLDWSELVKLPWICPTSSTCCGRAAERLFQEHGIQPKQIISIDNESVTQTLVAGGAGIGLLHASSAKDTLSDGEVELLCEVQSTVRVLFAHLSSRNRDPLLKAVSSLLCR